MIHPFTATLNRVRAVDASTVGDESLREMARAVYCTGHWRYHEHWPRPGQVDSHGRTLAQVIAEEAAAKAEEYRAEIADLRLRAEAAGMLADLADLAAEKHRIDTAE